MPSTTPTTCDKPASLLTGELAITLPLDVVERVLNALDRYVESEGGYNLNEGDDEAFTLAQREVEQIKRLANA